MGEAMGINLVYDYSVPRREESSGSELDWWKHLGEWIWRVDNENDLVGSSSKNIMTVFVDNAGKVMRHVKPSPDPIRLMFPELLALVGLPDFLDTAQENLG